jgi:NAD(P)-dependent dehydrogenase (short-subunit alcohol dehydrogenase family)
MSCFVGQIAQAHGKSNLPWPRFGWIDALVHNAGLIAFASVKATDQAMWNRMLSIVDASFHLARAAVPHMRWQGYGCIVITTSGRAMRVEHSIHGLVAYTVVKLAQSCPLIRKTLTSPFQLACL